jgi:hypothetical protein
LSLTGTVSGQVSGTATPLKKHSGGVPVPGSYDAIMQAVEEKVHFLASVYLHEVLRMLLRISQRNSSNFVVCLGTDLSNTYVYSVILISAPSVCVLELITPHV